jgi:recombinational DNA repair protein RecT
MVTLMDRVKQAHAEAMWNLRVSNAFYRLKFWELVCKQGADTYYTIDGKPSKHGNSLQAGTWVLIWNHMHRLCKEHCRKVLQRGKDMQRQFIAEAELAEKKLLIETGCLDSKEYIEQLKDMPSAGHDDRQDTAMQAMSGGLL